MQPFFFADVDSSPYGIPRGNLIEARPVYLGGVWRVPDSDLRSGLGVFKSDFQNLNQTDPKLWFEIGIRQILCDLIMISTTIFYFYNLILNNF